MSASSLRAACNPGQGSSQGQQQHPLHASSAAVAADSNWVPDDEVNECPLCNRKFHALLAPKHHCRACGRIVCGSCSNNRIFVPQKGRKARVCDPCNDLSFVDQHSTLTDSLATTRQMETSLKNNLKEMTQQADWFRSFLLQITSEGDAPAAFHCRATPTGSYCEVPSKRPSADDEDATGDLASSYVTTNSELVTEEELEAPQRLEASARQGHSPELESAPTASQDNLSSVLANLRDPEIADLIARARQRWKDTCEEVATCREENGRLEMDIEVLDRDYAEIQQEIKQLYKAVKNMEADLKTRSVREVERDELKHRTDEKQTELDGLHQRMATLEESLPSSRQGSFFSRAASDGSDGEAAGSSFFANVRHRCCCSESSAESQRCGSSTLARLGGREERRCIRPGACALM